jgi:hypothetical protein
VTYPAIKIIVLATNENPMTALDFERVDFIDGDVADQIRSAAGGSCAGRKSTP